MQKKSIFIIAAANIGAKSGANAEINAEINIAINSGAGQAQEIPITSVSQIRVLIQ